MALVALIIKPASLFLLLWFGYILVVKAARGHAASSFNIAVPAAAAVAFAWSMGWLS